MQYLDTFQEAKKQVALKVSLQRFGPEIDKLLGRKTENSQHLVNAYRSAQREKRTMSMGDIKGTLKPKTRNQNIGISPQTNTAHRRGASTSHATHRRPTK